MRLYKGKVSEFLQILQGKPEEIFLSSQNPKFVFVFTETTSIFKTSSITNLTWGGIFLLCFFTAFRFNHTRALMFFKSPLNLSRLRLKRKIDQKRKRIKNQNNLLVDVFAYTWKKNSEMAKIPVVSLNLKYLASYVA